MPPNSLTLQTSPTSQLQKGLGLAVLLHLLLAVILPGIPQLNIPAIDRGRGITVFLRQTPEQEVFQQTLNNPGELSNSLPDEVQSAAGLPTTPAGDSEALTDAAPQVESQRDDQRESNPAGSEQNSALAPSVFISRSSISLFAQQEAFMHAERNPENLQRFSRSFRSYASYRQRPRNDNYRDIYGDYYVRTSASRGDICFMQEKEQQPDDFSTNTVYFFRCSNGPKEFSLDTKTSDG